MNKPKIIAFYLPQFHPTPENDEWWSPGFTEWINLAKAKPLYPGHYQPKIPGELSFYDLRLAETREKQSSLALEYGIDAFCYWHYWFEGRRLLSDIINEVLSTGSPNFPFCFCWANHSWYKKTWTSKGPDKLLIEQTYGGEKDYERHFYEMLPAFKDNRYFKIDGKPVFGFYAPLHFVDIQTFTKTWNHLAKINGLTEFWFFGFTFTIEEIKSIKALGIQNVVLDIIKYPVNNLFLKFIKRGSEKILRLPQMRSYKKYTNRLIRLIDHNSSFIPCLIPNFDHTARSGRKGITFYNSSPQLWNNLLKKIKKIYSKRSNKNNIIFIKSWNEWGEGNYLEPDLKNGRKYLEAIKTTFINEK